MSLARLALTSPAPRASVVTSWLVDSTRRPRKSHRCREGWRLVACERILNAWKRADRGCWEREEKGPEAEPTVQSPARRPSLEPDLENGVMKQTKLVHSTLEVLVSTSTWV